MAQSYTERERERTKKTEITSTLKYRRNVDVNKIEKEIMALLCTNVRFSFELLVPLEIVMIWIRLSPLEISFSVIQ